MASIFSATVLSAAAVDIDSFDLPPGKSVTIELQVTVDSPMPPGDSQVCNQGTFAGTNPSAGVLTDDPDTGAAGDATCTSVLLLADLSITKSDGAASEVPGTPVTYIIVASNAGPATVGDGVVSDTFPAILSGCSTTAVGAGGASGFDAGPFAGNINDTGIVLPSGASVTYTATCNIAPGATGSLANTASISSASTSDPNAANNSVTDTDSLAPSTDVAITKTDGATTEIPGTSVTYTLVASNSGPSTATGVVVADTFPGILSSCATSSVAAGGATGNDAGPSAGNINDTGITLPPGATVTYTASCTIAATATGSLANTATISSATTDPNSGNNSATDTDTLTPTADVSITKTDGAVSEVPGTPVTYTIVVTNMSGPSVATGVTVTDTFPAVLSGCTTTSVAAGGATGNETGPVPGDLSDSGITLPAGGSVTFTANCNIDGAATGSLVNTASVATAITDSLPGNNSATDSDTLAPSADVAISKTDGSTTEVPGTPVTYTIIASNSGPSTATGVTVSDTFPAILTGCSTTSVAAGGATGNDAGPVAGNLNNGGITLPSGGSVTYTATCNIAGTATGSLANTASVSSATADPNSGNNSSTDTDTLVAAADVAITKTDGTGSVSPGASTTYTIVVSNLGPSTAAGVTVTDNFPAALTGCSTTSAAAGGATGNDPGPTGGNLNDGGISLPSGATVTYTATCSIDPGASGTIDNTASVTATTADPSSGNNSATDSDTVLPLDYGDAPNESIGAAFHYPVTQAQDGARHVTTGLTLGALRDNEADGLPAAAADGDDTNATDDEDGVVFTGDLVACGSTNVTVTSSGAGLLDAWIDWNRDGDWNDAGEQIAASTAVAGGGNLIAVAPPCGLTGGASFARFRLSTAGALLPTGQAANGEVEDHAVTLYGLDFGDAPDAGISVPYTFPVRLADDGARHAIRGPRLGAAADSEANGQPSAGALLDDNTGVPDDEDGVVFTSLIAPGLGGTVQVTASAAGLLNAWVDWNADGDWNDAGEKIFTDQALAVGVNNLGFTAPGGAPANTIVFSRFRLATASVAAPTGLAADGEVEDHPVTIAPVVALSITKTDGATTEVPGTAVAYTIVAANAGPSTAIGVTVADTFPAILTGCTTTSTAAGGATGNDAGPVVGNLNDTGITLPSGAAVTYTTSCLIDAAATGTLANTATISVPAGSFDPDVSNNSATDSDALAASADVAITKTDGSATEVPGTPVTYTIVASNAGPSVATGVTVADTFPATLTGCSTTSVAAGGATGNDAGPLAGNLGDTGITLPVGASVTYTATCNIAATASGTLVNTATVSSGVTDPTPGDHSATDTDNLNPTVDVSVTKTDGAADEVPGTAVTYTIVVSNATGPSVATGVTVTDTFPAILTGCSTTSVAAGGATGNDAGPSLGNLNDTGITLPMGAAVTYTATCNIDPAATGSLANTAAAAVPGGITDSNPANNSATDTDTLTPSADVAVSKTDGAASEVPGTPVTYTIVAGNSGPSVATGVTLSDLFPGILTGCSTTSVAAGGATGNDPGPTVADNYSDGGITLPVGGSVTYTATCNIDPAATGSLANTASATSGVADPNSANNSATDTDTLAPSADVAITKDDGLLVVAAGQSMVYTIVASNNGPSTATGVTVTDTFVAALTGCSTTSVATGGATGNDAGPTAGNINDGGITLPPGAAVSVTYTATCTLDAAATGTVGNTATITSATSDPVGGNNSATDTDTIQPQDYGDAPTAAQSGLAGSYPTTLALGGARHGTTGPTLGGARDSETTGQPTAAADGDDLAGSPDDEDGVTISALVACEPGTATATASAPGLLSAWLDWNRDGDWADAGERIATNQAVVAGPNVVSFTVPCGASIGNSFARFRLASAAIASYDGQATDGEVEDYGVALTKLVDLAISLGADQTAVAAGQIFHYEIEVQNLGPSNSLGFTVTHDLPPASSATFLGTSGTGWTCGAPVGLVLTCTHGPLADGAFTNILEVEMQVAAVPSPPAFSSSAAVAGEDPDPVAGNNSDEVLVSTDVTPPVVESLNTNEDTGDGVLAACETVRGEVGEISVSFSEALVTSATGPSETNADDPASYLLVMDGGDGEIATTGCEGGAAASDLEIAINSATYQANTPVAGKSRVVLAVGDQNRLRSGLYRLFVCGTVHDPANNGIDPDGEGPLEEGDFSRLIRVDAFNLFDNGNFDCSAASWQTVAANWDPAADHQGSDQSGGMVATQNGASVKQCVSFGAQAPARERAAYELEGFLAIDPILNQELAWNLKCEFFSGPACTGSVSAPMGKRVTSDDNPVLIKAAVRFDALPAGAVSARCGFSFESQTAFTAEVDGLSLRGTAPLFSDGFELGNTSKWQ